MVKKREKKDEQKGEVVATQPAVQPAAEPQQRRALAKSAIMTLSDRMGVEPTAMFMASLRNVAFKSPDVSEEQLMALVVVANQYKLNPFTRELYAFPDRSGGIVPIVSVDGWFRIINEHPQNDGIEYEEIRNEAGELIAGEVTIHRKDRTYATVIREYLKEVRRSTDPWKQHESRMLRHKTIIQGGRVAFGFAGIYEPDEGERVLEAQRVVPAQAGSAGVLATLTRDPPQANGDKDKPIEQRNAESQAEAEAEEEAERVEDEEAERLRDGGQERLPV